jgi:hypothetical protein
MGRPLGGQFYLPPVRSKRQKKLFRKSRMPWQDDLDFGNKWQSWYIEMVQPDEVTVMKGNFKEYDAVLDGEKVEFKAEKLIAKYGNICIEYRSRDKPSGIMTTEADYYIIMSIVDDSVQELWKVPTGTLRNMIDAKSYHRDTKGGDGWANQMFLFKKELFTPYKVEV